MEVYRLSRARFASELSGAGAALKGGRWNPAGVEAVYAASNRSLAMAEVAVHLTLATLPDDYCLVTIYIPDEVGRLRVRVADLPSDWNYFPHNAATQQFGLNLLSSAQYGVFELPSAVTQGDYNLMINPHHPDFARIKIVDVTKFPFDRRIFKSTP